MEYFHDLFFDVLYFVSVISFLSEYIYCSEVHGHCCSGRRGRQCMEYFHDLFFDVLYFVSVISFLSEYIYCSEVYS